MPLSRHTHGSRAMDAQHTLRISYTGRHRRGQRVCEHSDSASVDEINWEDA